MNPVAKAFFADNPQEPNPKIKPWLIEPRLPWP